MKDDNQQIIEQLILSGALEPAGIDMQTGEVLYNFTKKLETDFPEIHTHFMTFFSQETMFLWENGFIEMDVTEKNPMVSLTKKAFNQKEVNKLDKDKQYSLKELIRLLAEEE